jgi:hypothetical protein
VTRDPSSPKGFAVARPENREPKTEDGNPNLEYLNPKQIRNTKWEKIQNDRLIDPWSLYLVCFVEKCSYFFFRLRL